MGNGYNDPYSPVQTGAAFMSGMMRSYNNNLMKQADLMQFKHQMARQKTQDAYVTEQRQNARFDRNLQISTAVRNLEQGGEGQSEYANMLRSGLSGGFTGITKPTGQTSGPASYQQMDIATPGLDTLGAAGVQSKMPMRIGGTARTYDDSGKEYVTKDGLNYPVKTTKGPYGTTSRTADTSRIIPTKRGSSFKETKKIEAGELRPILEAEAKGLGNSLGSTLLGTGQKLNIVQDVLNKLERAAGISGGDPEYEAAVQHDEAIPGIGDDQYRAAVDVIVGELLDADMEETERTELLDSLASTGKISTERVIEASVPKEMGNAWNTLRDIFSRRFSEADRAGEVVRGAKAMQDNLVKYGFVTESGQPDRERISQEVNDQIRKHPEDYKEIYRTALAETGDSAKAEDIVNSKALKTYLEMRAEAAVNEIIGSNFGKGRMHKIADVIAKPTKVLIKHNIKQQKAGRQALPGTMGMGYIR